MTDSEPDIDDAAMAGAMIAAAETEDEMGCVLRMHLMCERLLSAFIANRTTVDTKPYIREPKYFSEKLGLSVAIGLPVPLAAVFRQINTMRNKFAHGDLAKAHIDRGDVQNLARLVDSLSCIETSFTPLRERRIEMPVARPGEKFTFGESGRPHIDFLIAAAAFWACARRWIVAHRVTSP